MSNIQQRIIIFLSACLVFLLTFFGPSWLSIFGIAPCWVILWLLPWSIEKGETSGVIAAILFGALLDSISYGNTTQIPILILLGFWWGRLGRRNSQIKYSFTFGLLAWIGTFLFGLSVWIQTIIFDTSGNIFFIWGLKNMITQSFLTGLFAPIICSWIILILRPRSFFGDL